MADNDKAPRAGIRLPTFGESMASFLFALVSIGFCAAVWDAWLHIPLMCSTAFAAIIAKRCGYNWKQIERGMFNGIYSVLQAILILITVGALIGVWIRAGVTPSLIYYGLAILNPTIFLITALLICSITSLIIGTSWGTAGTIGVAFMGIGMGLGIPPAITAGAVISGAYFGDKIAPLSDTTNMAAAIAGVDLIAHIKNMFRQTGIAYGFAIVIFLVIGFFFTGTANLESAEQIRAELRADFIISPFLLLPIVIVLVAIALKVPALPGIFLGVIVGGIFGIIFQSGVDLETMINVAYRGIRDWTYSSEQVIALFANRGGIFNKWFAISIIMIALSFGGIMESSRQLEVIVNRIIKIFVRGTGSLVATTVGTTIVTNMAMADQYLGIILPAKMFGTAYKTRGFHPKMLSAGVDGTGTMTSALIPWNTCGVAMAGFLGVSTFAYLPFAFFNWSVPIVIIILGAIGKFTRRIEDDPNSLTDPLVVTPGDEIPSDKK